MTLSLPVVSNTKEGFGLIEAIGFLSEFSILSSLSMLKNTKYGFQIFSKLSADIKFGFFSFKCINLRRGSYQDLLMSYFTLKRPFTRSIDIICLK